MQMQLVHLHDGLSQRHSHLRVSTITRICDLVKKNVSHVNSNLFYPLEFSIRAICPFKVLHIDFNPITIGHLVGEMQNFLNKVRHKKSPHFLTFNSKSILYTQLKQLISLDLLALIVLTVRGNNSLYIMIKCCMR